eukprot:CAMPEP_0115498442 /NCGR_PEP_ID=MMETSP0271-20121206/66801_1 /TAXON_ID=71861 /ORGANISM="Scrippsiella trochoidea, Strain CCMP3099" /LENGTH=34 /DNA_ID= /DNA_START= /DNA_END= /DNA_ORIENTATION=
MASAAMQTPRLTGSFLYGSTKSPRCAAAYTSEPS